MHDFNLIIWLYRSLRPGRAGDHFPIDRNRDATALAIDAFGIKAAFPLLHNWLQDAYPQATVTGTVFLSSFTTKLSIYALARGFPGTEMLIWIGATMALFPLRRRCRFSVRFSKPWSLPIAKASSIKI